MSRFGSTETALSRGKAAESERLFDGARKRELRRSAWGGWQTHTRNQAVMRLRSRLAAQLARAMPTGAVNGLELSLGIVDDPVKTAPAPTAC